ncbi:hypothetical protein CL653_00420 [bacterium]|nr:hypothetical protein [bacterium]|tara:strand:+ start:2014 stop:2328 length:315 start_codon:yes stop_codon:yes gene_type:complete
MNVTTDIVQRDSKILMMMFGVLVFLALMYMYFVSSTILHTVVRKEVAKSIIELESKIAELETDYILAQNSINTELAIEKGFIPNDNKKLFADRSVSTLVLSTGN